MEVCEKNGLPCQAMFGHTAITEKIGPQTIELQGLTPGRPVLISISFDRGWRSTSGETIYEASPAFMLVYPRGDTLKLVHGPTWPHWLGLALTICGGVLGLFIAARPLGLELRLGRISNFIGRPPLKRQLLALILILVAAGVVGYGGSTTTPGLYAKGPDWRPKMAGWNKPEGFIPKSSVNTACVIWATTASMKWP